MGSRNASTSSNQPSPTAELVIPVTDYWFNGQLKHISLKRLIQDAKYGSLTEVEYALRKIPTVTNWKYASDLADRLAKVIGNRRNTVRGVEDLRILEREARHRCRDLKSKIQGASSADNSALFPNPPNKASGSLSYAAASGGSKAPAPTASTPLPMVKRFPFGGFVVKPDGKLADKADCHESVERAYRQYFTEYVGGNKSVVGGIEHVDHEGNRMVIGSSNEKAIESFSKILRENEGNYQVIDYRKFVNKRRVRFILHGMAASFPLDMVLSAIAHSVEINPNPEFIREFATSSNIGSEGKTIEVSFSDADASKLEKHVAANQGKLATGAFRCGVSVSPIIESEAPVEEMDAEEEKKEENAVPNPAIDGEAAAAMDTSENEPETLDEVIADLDKAVQGSSKSSPAKQQQKVGEESKAKPTSESANPTEPTVKNDGFTKPSHLSRKDRKRLDFEKRKRDHASTKDSDKSDLSSLERTPPKKPTTKSNKNGKK